MYTLVYFKFTEWAGYPLYRIAGSNGGASKALLKGWNRAFPRFLWKHF